MSNADNIGTETGKTAETGSVCVSKKNDAQAEIDELFKLANRKLAEKSRGTLNNTDKRDENQTVHNETTAENDEPKTKEPEKDGRKTNSKSVKTISVEDINAMREKISGVPIKNSEDDEDGEKSSKTSVSNYSLGLFLRTFMGIIIPISIILTVMLIGQNYVKNKSADKMRIISIETVPLNEENTTQAILLNINTATAAELTYLPGIGETKAKNIIEYRNVHGSFSDISEIMNVSGIGESTYEKIKPYITV